MADTSYSFMGRIGVFMLGRNEIATRAGVTPRQEPPRCNPLEKHRPWSSVLAAQLPKGAVVVMFSHFQGGPAPMCNFRTDSVHDSLAALVDTLSSPRDTSGSWGVSFQKWNDDWQVTVLENGATGADRRAVRALLHSVTFRPAPVLFAGQAISLAHEALKRAGGAGARLDVAVVPVGGDFRVEFQECRSCEDAPAAEAPKPSHRWMFLVHRAGVVDASE